MSDHITRKHSQLQKADIHIGKSGSIDSGDTQSPAAKWYYKKNGVQHGPVSAEILAHLAGTGELLANDLVRTEDTSYVPADNFTHLVFQSQRADKETAAASKGIFKVQGGHGFAVEGAVVSLLLLFCVVPWFGFTSWRDAIIAAAVLGYAPFVLVSKIPTLDEGLSALCVIGIPVSAISLLVAGVIFGFGGGGIEASVVSKFKVGAASILKNPASARFGECDVRYVTFPDCPPIHSGVGEGYYVRAMVYGTNSFGGVVGDLFVGSFTEDGSTCYIGTFENAIKKMPQARYVEFQKWVKDNLGN